MRATINPLTNRMNRSQIYKIRFRSTLPLKAIASRLGLSDVTEDCENEWGWVIGKCCGIEIDITREHGPSRGKVDTIIFALDGSAFSEELLRVLLEKLRVFLKKRRIKY